MKLTNRKIEKMVIDLYNQNAKEVLDATENELYHIAENWAIIILQKATGREDFRLSEVEEVAEQVRKILY